MVVTCSTISWVIPDGVCVSSDLFKLILAEVEAARLTFEICSAMAYTHAMNVTHRDLKPEVGILHERADVEYPSDEGGRLYDCQDCRFWPRQDGYVLFL